MADPTQAALKRASEECENAAACLSRAEEKLNEALIPDREHNVLAPWMVKTMYSASSLASRVTVISNDLKGAR